MFFLFNILKVDVIIFSVSVYKDGSREGEKDVESHH